jgi:glycosyltransferase involved in cell wall biosynthesis
MQHDRNTVVTVIGDHECAMPESNIVPAVSIVIPAYRSSCDIALALESVFAQTFDSFEVLVVNDGSPDSGELEAALAPYRERIRYFAQPNRGAGAARNTAIRAARGRYVAFLDADDRWVPEFLVLQTGYLDAHSACGLVYADAHLSGESPSLSGRRFMDASPSSGDVTLIGLIEQRCNILLSTVMVRRELLLEAGLFDESLRRGHDFDLWLRLALRGVQIRYRRAVLAERRIRTGGLSGSAVDEIQRALNVLDRFWRAHALDRDACTAIRVRVMALVDRLEIEQAKQRIAEGNFHAARYHLNAAQERSWKLRAAQVALSVAPRLLRAVYLRLRPPVWRVPVPAQQGTAPGI